MNKMTIRAATAAVQSSGKFSTIQEKIESEPPHAIELHNRIRVERSSAVARVFAWLAGRAVRMVLVYHSRQTLRGMNDEQLRDVGLTRAEVERNGWI